MPAVPPMSFPMPIIDAFFSPSHVNITENTPNMMLHESMNKDNFPTENPLVPAALPYVENMPLPIPPKKHNNEIKRHNAARI